MGHGTWDTIPVATVAARARDPSPSFTWSPLRLSSPGGNERSQAFESRYRAAMPDADVIRTTIADYLARFTAGDREGWLDLWAPDATLEDPVGSPVRVASRSSSV